MAAEERSRSTARVLRGGIPLNSPLFGIRKTGLRLCERARERVRERERTGRLLPENALPHNGAAVSPCRIENKSGRVKAERTREIDRVITASLVSPTSLPLIHTRT